MMGKDPGVWLPGLEGSILVTLDGIFNLSELYLPICKIGSNSTIYKWNILKNV